MSVPFAWAPRLLTVLALALASAARPASADDPPTPLVMVPAVSGNYAYVAEDLIRSMGLVPVRRDGALTSGSSRNSFLQATRQSPEPGRMVVPGSAVYYWWDFVGPTRISDFRSLPDVIGLPLRRATERLRDLDLRVTSQVRQGGDGPQVVEFQTPPPGFHTQVGAHVHLLARPERPAPGPDVADVRAVVPNLIGRTRSDADRLLSTAGLRGSWLGDVAGTEVYQQSPGGGERLARGTGVHVWLRRAAATASTVVPNVVGRIEADANRMLRAAGLVPSRVAGPEGGIVVRQDPPSGLRVPRDSVVRLSLAVRDTVTTVVVPHVVGRSFAQADTLLRAAGLVARRAGPGRSAIVRQSPGAGARVPRGAEVQVVPGK